MLSVHPAAEAEFLDAVIYYESRVSELGSRLVDEFERLTDHIVKNPEAWQVIGHESIRKASFKHFPMSIIYRHSSDTIEVLAIAHDKRRPQYWMSRTS